MLNITEKGGANVEELVRDSILPSVDEVGIILLQRSPKNMNIKNTRNVRYYRPNISITI